MAVVTVQEQCPQMLSMGLFGAQATALALTNAGATSVWAAFSFVCPPLPAGTWRFSAFKFYITAVSSTPTLTAMLYSDLYGVPNTLIESGSVTVSPIAAGWFECSGFTATSNLTAGTQYWIVIKNTAGTSASITWVPNTGFQGGFATGSQGAGTGVGYGFNKHNSTNAGTGWTGTAVAQVGGLRFTITNGTDVAYLGIPTRGTTTANGTTERLCTNGANIQEYGTVFTMPSNLKFSLSGICFYCRKVSATGNLVFRLYTGDSTSATASTQTLAPGYVSSSVSLYTLYFATPQTLMPGVKYRITAANTNPDSTSAYYYLYKTLVDDTAESKSLMPFGALASSRRSGSSWATDLTTEFAPMILVGNASGEFLGGTYPPIGHVHSDTESYGLSNELIPALSMLTNWSLKSAYQNPGAANVVVGNNYLYAGVSQTASYPTTATSKAEQLAEDQAAVLAAAEWIIVGHSILSQAGSFPIGDYTLTSTIPTDAEIAAAVWTYADRTLTA